MVRRAILVLGDQLSEELAVLRDGDPARDMVVMAEVPDETGYVPHHPRKIVLVLSAMRHFAEELRAADWDVRYFRLDEEGPRSICGARRRSAAAGWRRRLSRRSAGGSRPGSSRCCS